MVSVTHIQEEEVNIVDSREEQQEEESHQPTYAEAAASAIESQDDEKKDAEEDEDKDSNEKTLDSAYESEVNALSEEIAQDIANVVAAAEKDEDFEDEDDDEEDDDEEDDDEDDDEYEEDVANETVLERIVALKGAIPPYYRYTLANVGSSAYSTLSTAFKFSGKAIWIITTSSLLLGVPLTLSVISEQQLIEMEKEMKLTQSTNELLAPGAESGFQQAPVAA